MEHYEGTLGADRVGRGRTGRADPRAGRAIGGAPRAEGMASEVEEAGRDPGSLTDLTVGLIAPSWTTAR